MVVPEASPEALRLYWDSVLVWAFRGAWGITVLAALCLGASARLRDWARRWSGGRWLLEVSLFGAAFALLLGILLLPPAGLALWVQQTHGRATLAMIPWLVEAGGRVSLGAILAAALLWIPYALLRRARGRTWLLLWFAFVPVFFATQLAGALFASTGDAVSLPDKGLEVELRALASRAGIGDPRILMQPASAQAQPMFAEMTGLGAGAQIVIGQTTIAQLSRRQLLAAVAHEMGHQALWHKWQDAAFTLVAMLLALGFAQAAGTLLVSRYAARLGFSSLDDVASAPLLLALLTVAFALLAPFQRALERAEEHAADVFALELTRDPQAFAEGLLAVQRGRLINPRPHPIVHALRGTHPPLADRIELANRYVHPQDPPR